MLRRRLVAPASANYPCSACLPAASCLLASLQRAGPCLDLQMATPASSCTTEGTTSRGGSWTGWVATRPAGYHEGPALAAAVGASGAGQPARPPARGDGRGMRGVAACCACACAPPCPCTFALVLAPADPCPRPALPAAGLGCAAEGEAREAACRVAARGRGGGREGVRWARSRRSIRTRRRNGLLLAVQTVRLHRQLPCCRSLCALP